MATLHRISDKAYIKMLADRMKGPAHPIMEIPNKRAEKSKLGIRSDRKSPAKRRQASR